MVVECDYLNDRFVFEEYFILLSPKEKSQAFLPALKTEERTIAKALLATSPQTAPSHRLKRRKSLCGSRKGVDHAETG